MNEFSAMAEYAVKKKMEDDFKKKRDRDVALMITFNLIAGIVVYIFFGLIGVALVWLLFTILDVLVYRLLYHIEYECSIAAGELTVAKITDGYLRKELLSVPVADLETVAPYREPYRTTADRQTFVRTVDAASSSSAADRYFAIIVDKEDSSNKTLLLFEPSAKLLRLFAVYNRHTVVAKPAETASLGTP